MPYKNCQREPQKNDLVTYPHSETRREGFGIVHDGRVNPTTGNITVLVNTSGIGWWKPSDLVYVGTAALETVIPWRPREEPQ